MGYFKETLKGISWVGTLRGSTRVISFVKTIILARILIPAQFGLYGVAFLVLEFLEILTETGINVFLLQENEDIDGYINTAWVVSIIRGIIISILIFLSSYQISVFFHMPGARNLLILICLVPLLRGFINPSVIKFQKNLDFRTDFVYRFLIFFFDATVAVVVALITRQAYSLIIGLIAGVILEIILSFLLAKPAPKLTLEISRAKEVVHRGKWLTGAGIFKYFFENGDDIVVGRILGSAPLGLYGMAYNLATLPISEVGDVFGKVTLPIYVKISADNNRLKRAFAKTTLTVSVLSLIFVIFLVLFSKQIILIVLGPNWLAATDVLKVVSIYAVFKAAINPSLTVLLAKQKQEYVTVITFFGILGMAASILPLTYKYGIVGTGASTIIGLLFSLPFVFYYLSKTLFRSQNP